MKKFINIIKNILVWLVVLLAISMMIFTIVSVNSFDRTDRDIFGYRAFIVRSDSMSATDFSAGDLILVKEVDPSVLKQGDIISFKSTSNESYGEVITHKIRELTQTDKGEDGFVTYGTTTDENDDQIVTYPYVLGKYQFKLAGVGRFFAFLKTVPGYFICIFLPFMILIAMQAINSVKLYKRYKRQQRAELRRKRAKERAEIEAERRVLEQEKEELLRLKSELLEKKENQENVSTE